MLGLWAQEPLDHGNMKEKVYVQTGKKLGETMDVDHSISCPHVKLFVLQTLKLMIVTPQTCANWMVMFITPQRQVLEFDD